jgi:hypothetical protein
MKRRSLFVRFQGRALRLRRIGFFELEQKGIKFKGLFAGKMYDLKQ